LIKQDFLGKVPQRRTIGLVRFDLGFQTAFQTQVAIGQIVPEIIHLAVLKTAILIHQFSVLPLALIVIGLTDKLDLLGMMGAEQSHGHFLAD
jgi:hypothetical protein